MNLPTSMRVLLIRLHLVKPRTSPFISMNTAVAPPKENK